MTAIMTLFAILAIMTKLEMVINMAIMGVFLKRGKNADQTRKLFVNISTGLGDPLGCSDLSQIFFGSSPTGIEWDNIRLLLKLLLQLMFF